MSWCVWIYKQLTCKHCRFGEEGLTHDFPFVQRLGDQASNNVYIKFFKNWPRISRGDVENVKIWTTTDKVALVKLTWTFGSCELKS